MTATPFHNFIDLVQFDQALMSLMDKRDSLQIKIQNLSLQKKDEQQKFTDAKMLLHNLIKKRDALDLESGSLDQEKQKKEDRLATVASPREYKSLQNEIQTCLERLNVLEDDIVQTWQLIEQAEEGLEKAEQRHNEQLQILEQQEKEKNAELVEVEQEIAKLANERESKLTDIPTDWLANYDMMRERIAHPVVQVTDRICPGCFNQLPASMIATLRRHVLVPCPSCSRLLYSL